MSSSSSRGKKKPENGYNPSTKRSPLATHDPGQKPSPLQKAASAPGFADAILKHPGPPQVLPPPPPQAPRHGTSGAGVHVSTSVSHSAVVVPFDVPPLPPPRAFSLGSRSSSPSKKGYSLPSYYHAHSHAPGTGHGDVGKPVKPVTSSQSIATTRLFLSPTKLVPVSEGCDVPPPLPPERGTTPVATTTVSTPFTPPLLPPPRPSSHTRSRPQPPSKARRPYEYLTYHPFKYESPVSNIGSTTSSSSNKSHTSSTSSSSSSLSSSTAVRTSSPLVPSSGAPLTPQQGNHPVTFARPPPREMEYTEREHPRNTFEYMNQMRIRGDLCDITLVVDTKEIRAHKVVLAACSQYFEQMFIGEFAEPENEPIIIDEVEEDALMELIDFSYTSRIKLTDHNIYSLFEAADLLQFAGIKGACFKFFKQQINKSNCIRTWLFAEGHNCTELIEAAVKYIECNFLDIVRGREFLNIEQVDIVARILALEDLAITSEEQVYEAALGWLHHDPRRRKQHATLVFKNVRFPSMSRDYLMHIVDSEPFIKEDTDCLQQLIEALETHVSSTRVFMRRKLKREGNYSNMKPRPASMAVEVVEIYRKGSILGLRVMGGSDRPNHVFRQGNKSGIFILSVTADGAAAKVGRLRSGDRILKVNESDVSNAKHDQAIRLLKLSPDPLKLLIRHEPPPLELQELTLVTKPGEGFGFSISGGVSGYPGNPLDETDEGIFISQIIPGGASEQDGRLHVGMRILQVNSISLLGKTQEEALMVLHCVLDRINLLVCHGYNPEDVPDTIDTVDEFGYVGSEPLYEPATMGP